MKKKKVSVGILINQDLKDRAYYKIQNKLGLTISQFIENKFKELLQDE